MIYSHVKAPPSIIAPDSLAFSPPTLLSANSSTHSRPDSLISDEQQPLLGSSCNARKKPFYRPRPLWLIPFAVFVAASKGMTVAPRIQVYTQLSCNAIHQISSGHATNSQSLGTRIQYSHSYGPVLTAMHLDFATLPKDEFAFFSTAVLSDCLHDPAVQAKTARLQTTLTVIAGALSLWAHGWWTRLSERHGRTTVLVLGTFGWLLSDVIFVFACMLDMPWSKHGHHILFIAPIFEGIFGGWATLQTVTIAYISDSTPSSSRSQVLSSFTWIFYFGLSFGSMIASWLIRKQLPLLDAFRFSSSNVIPVFCISIATALVNILFLLLVIPESLSKEHQTGVRAETTNRFADSVAPRPEGSLLFRHALSWLIPILPKRIFNGNGSSHKDCSMPLTACALFGHLLTMGAFQSKYLYSEHVYGWNAEQLSYYASFTGGTRAFYLLLILSPIIAIYKSTPRTKQAPQAPQINRPYLNGPHRPLPKLVLSPPPPPPPPLSKTYKVKQSPIELLRNQMAFELRIIQFSFIVDMLSQLLVLAAPAPTYHAHAIARNMNQRSSAALFILASSLAGFASGATPATQNLALCFVRYDTLRDGGTNPTDVGELFKTFAIVQTLGSMIVGPLIFGMVYSKTVSAYPKMIFAVSAILLFLSLTSTFMIRPQRIPRENKAPRRQIIRESEVVRGRSRVKKDLRKNYSGCAHSQP